MGRLQEFLTRQFGFELKSREHEETLGAAAVRIALNNPNRVQVSVMNLSAVNAYIAFDSGVAITHGFLLAANGGQFSLIARDDGDLPGRELYAISAAGALTIFVSELEALN